MAWKPEQQQEEPQQSKFNSAIYKLGRLHESWLIVRKHWRERNEKKLMPELENIYFELYTDVQKKHKDEWNKLNRLLIYAMKERRKALAGYRNHYQEYILQDEEYEEKHEELNLRYKSMNGMVWRVFRKMHFLLTEMEKSQGLSRSYVDIESEQIS